MRRTLRQSASLLLAVLATLLVARAPRAQDAPARTVRGIVTDSAGSPVVYAQVRLGGSPATITDSLGVFEVHPRGEPPWSLEIRRIGYYAARLQLEGIPGAPLEITLDRGDAALERVMIEAELSARNLELKGFYRRLRDHASASSAMHVVMPEDVEERRAHRASLLADGLPGVRILLYRFDRRRTYYSLFGSSQCPLTIYLDGTRLNDMSNPRLPVDIDNLIPVRDIAAVEAYARTSSPAQYQVLPGTCGVVMFWTR